MVLQLKNISFQNHNKYQIYPDCTKNKQLCSNVLWDPTQLKTLAYVISDIIIHIIYNIKYLIHDGLKYLFSNNKNIIFIIYSMRVTDFCFYELIEMILITLYSLYIENV